MENTERGPARTSIVTVHMEFAGMIPIWAPEIAA
jgi:hypothetical protein